MESLSILQDWRHRKNYEFLISIIFTKASVTFLLQSCFFINSSLFHWCSCEGLSMLLYCSTGSTSLFSPICTTSLPHLYCRSSLGFIAPPRTQTPSLSAAALYLLGSCSVLFLQLLPYCSSACPSLLRHHFDIARPQLHHISIITPPLLSQYLVATSPLYHHFISSFAYLSHDVCYNKITYSRHRYRANKMLILCCYFRGKYCEHESLAVRRTFEWLIMWERFTNATTLLNFNLCFTLKLTTH